MRTLISKYTQAIGQIMEAAGTDYMEDTNHVDDVIVLAGVTLHTEVRLRRLKKQLLYRSKIGTLEIEQDELQR